MIRKNFSDLFRIGKLFFQTVNLQLNTLLAG